MHALVHVRAHTRRCQILLRLRDHQGMIRVVLNKADQVDKAKLRRVSRYITVCCYSVADALQVGRKNVC